MIPPGEPGDDAIAGTVIVNVLTIPVGSYLVGDPPRLVSEEEAQRLLGNKPTPLIAPPVVEPIAVDGLIEAEMIEIEDETKTQAIGDAGVTLSREVLPEVESGDVGVLVVRSAGLERRRTK
jgi:hypothetical protein